MVRPAARRPAGLIALALAAGSAGCAHLRGTPDAPAVIRVRVAGAESARESEIVAKLATHESERPPRIPIAGPLVFQAKLELGGVEVSLLDRDALSVDRRRVEAFYRERGYYAARVEDAQVLPAGPGRVDVVFRVNEGQPVRVTKLTVKGLDDAPEAKARASRLPLAVGDVFTEAAYDTARVAILGALRGTGWAHADVTQEAVVLPDPLAAEVTYEARPGARYRFGSIHVAGTSTKTIPHHRIRDQVTAVIHTGEWWDESKLAQAQARVFDLGVFGGVRVTPGSADAQRGTIPVVVAVREARFQTVRFGPGLGFEARRWEARGLFGWQHRNFLGDLRRVSTDLRLGYAWVPNPFATVKEGPFTFVAGEFQQPAAFTRYVDGSVRLELERGVQDAYDFFAERLRLGLPLRIASRWTLAPSYNLEVYQLSNTAVDFAPGASATDGGPVLENCRGSVCLLSYLEQRIAWDGRDDPVNTRRGYYVALSVQEGFTIQSYGYQYFRLLPELRAFYPLGPRTVVAFRTRVGALVPVRASLDPPLVARFTAGGPLSMRGYYTRRLAPMVRQRGEWVPVGGNGAADGSLELRLALTGNLGAVLFLDGGSVADASKKPSAWQTALDPTRIQWATGFGLRYRTPFGPVRLDVAARLPDRFGADTFAHNFPVVPFTAWDDGSPHREPILAIHLALGEAF